jgi:hypothetical protein
VSAPVNIRDIALQAAASRSVEEALSKEEKTSFITLYDQILNTQIVLNAQADQFSVTTEKTSYGSAITTLTNYLTTLNIPVAWNNVTNITKVVRTTFINNFNAVETAKKVLVTKINFNIDVAVDTATSNASNALNSATTANNAVTDIADDNKFTAGEKQILRIEWNNLISEKAGINNTSSIYAATSTENTTYNSAIQTLGTYLNGGAAYTLSTTVPPSWINDASLGTTTAIVGSTFRANWKSVYDARQALLNDIAVEAGKVAAWATIANRPTDAELLNSAIVVGGRNLYKKTSPFSALISANVSGQSSAGFTLFGNASYNGALRLSQVITKNGEFTISFDVVTQYGPQAMIVDFCDGTQWNLTPTTTVQHFSHTFTVTNYTAAQMNFIDFNGLSDQNYVFTNFKLEVGNKETGWTPAPEDVAEDTAAAQAAADAANTILAVIANDNILSKGEKPAVLLQWEAINNEITGLGIQADALGVSPANYYNAKTLLDQHLNGIANGWSTLTTDSPVDGPTFRLKFKNYYTEKQALINAMAAKAATTANWASGLSGRPTDAELLNSAIVVGGRNLQPDSGFERGTHPCTSKSGPVGTVSTFNYAGVYAGSRALFLETAGGDAYLYIGGGKAPVVAGRQYMVSFHYRTSTAGTIIAGSSHIWSQSTGEHFSLPLPVLHTGPNNWVRAEVPWTCPAGVTEIEMRFGINCSGYSWMVADCIQIEEGNKATQWSPAPEDTLADIAAAETNAINTAATAAQAKADLAVVTANAYADGKVTAEEQRAILDATNKASAAETAAKNAAALDATTKANAAALTANWSGVVNNDGNRPANGATVGADASNLKAGVGINRLANSIPNNVLGLSFYKSHSQTVDTNAVQFIPKGYVYDIYSPLRQCTLLRNPGVGVDGQTIDLILNANAKQAVTAGQRYEFAVYASAHRCYSSARIAWYNNAGGDVGQSGGDIGSFNDQLAYNSAGGFPRRGVFGVAPAGAAYAMCFVRMHEASGQSDLYLFVSGFFFGEALPAQTTFTPWADGAPQDVRAIGYTGDLAATAGASLLHNGSFETGVSGWALKHSGNAGAAINSVAVADAYAGTNVLELTANNTGCAVSKAVAVTPGKAYRVRFRYRAQANYVQTYFYYGLSGPAPSDGYNGFPAEGSALWLPLPTSVEGTILAVSSAWSVYDQVLTMPAGVYWMSLGLHRWAGSGAGAKLQIDDVAILEYIGDNNASYGAPAGTPVAGVAAETVAAGAANGTTALNTLNNALSISITNNFIASRANSTIAVSVGTATVNISGGSGSYSIAWAVDSAESDPDGQIVTLSLTNADTVTVSAKAKVPSNTRLIARVSATVSDTQGRVAVKTAAISCQFGTAQ